MTLILKLIKWPEPTKPINIQIDLTAAQQAHALWQHFIPTVQWEWIRWIRATNNPEIRKKRIEVVPSKLRSRRTEAMLLES